MVLWGLVYYDAMHDNFIPYRTPKRSNSGKHGTIVAVDREEPLPQTVVE